jgi:hypothetical protein
MGQTLWGFFSLVAVVGLVFFCFRRTLPLNSKTREASEINKHASYGEGQTGSNWSTSDYGGHHHG